MEKSKKVKFKVNEIEKVPRRRFISTAGVVASTAVAAPAILRSGLAYAAGRPIKLGYISPKQDHLHHLPRLMISSSQVYGRL